MFIIMNVMLILNSFTEVYDTMHSMWAIMIGSQLVSVSLCANIYVSKLSLVDELMRLDIINHVRLAHVILLGLTKQSLLTD